MIQQCEQPFISIVIISRDRHELLEGAVKSILKMDYPSERYEIVVVEEGDKPFAVSQTKYVFLPRRNLGLGYARNQGVTHSKGEIILFTDDDCIVDKNWANEMVRAIAENKVKGVAGTTLAQKGNSIGRCEEILGFPGGGLKRHLKANGKITPTKLLSGCNCGYAKKIFGTMKFEEKGYGALGADDYVLGIKVSEKYGCVYNPNAIVYHKPRGSLVKIIKWFERRRINEFLVNEKNWGKKNYGVFFRSWYQIVLFRIGVLLGLILGGKLTSMIAVCFILLYILVLYLRHYKIVAYRRDYSVLFVLPFVKIFMDIGILKAEIKYLCYPYKSLLGALGEYSR